MLFARIGAGGCHCRCEPVQNNHGGAVLDCPVVCRANVRRIGTPQVKGASADGVRGHPQMA